MLPVAAVLVFDGLAAEYRADWEADHGRKAFRMRFGLLLLRRMVDKEGTKAAFREQITAIPVSALVGLGADLASAEQTRTVPEQRTEPEPEPIERPEPVPPLPPAELSEPSDADVLLASEPPAWLGMTKTAAIERADAILPGRTGQEIADALAKVGIITTDGYVRTVRNRIAGQHAQQPEQQDARVIPFQSAHGA